MLLEMKAFLDLLDSLDQYYPKTIFHLSILTIETHFPLSSFNEIHLLQSLNHQYTLSPSPYSSKNPLYNQILEGLVI